jgi:hypothetical protein
MSFSRRDLLAIYEALETMRNGAQAQREHLEKTMKKMGGEIPAFAIDHMKETNRGLEVLMCTVGAGIVPERRDEVRAIWEMLVGSKQHLLAAFAHLREVEEKSSRLTGAESDTFGLIEDAAWLQACQFVPTIFMMRL